MERRIGRRDSGDYLKDKTIRGMQIRTFRGCLTCPVSECQRTLLSSRVLLRHIGDERWDNWGRIGQVFARGDLLEVEIRHDETAIYCATAESTYCARVVDYIDLTNFEEVGP